MSHVETNQYLLERAEAPLFLQAMGPLIVSLLSFLFVFSSVLDGCPVLGDVTVVSFFCPVVNDFTVFRGIYNALEIVL